MRKLCASLLALACLGGAYADLGPGSTAPALKVAKIVKGKQVDLTKGVHVVEFWATWCGPCKVSIPHLTELAKKHKGKVSFTGVSVWENGPDQLGGVQKFVNEWGDKMAYNVAFDGDAQYMAKNWMEAAGQNGIPASFLVKDGKILWIGHPMSGLDQAIDQVLAGKFDAAKAKAAHEKEAAEAKRQQQMAKERQAKMKPLMDAVAAKNGDAVLKAIDDVIEPGMRSYYRYMALNQIGDPRAENFAKLLAADEKADPMMLNSIAWPMVEEGSPKPNYALGLVLAEAAAKRSEMKDAMILDTYGLALFRNGQKEKAVEVQTKALELAKADSRMDAATLKEISDRLAQFKKG